MGFFTTLGRMVRGEPVFQTNDSTTGAQNNDKPLAGASERPRESFQDLAQEVKHNPPQLHIERVEPVIQNDSFMRLWLSVKNPSKWNVEIDSIEALGHSSDMYKYLTPGEVEQIKAYEGPMLKVKPHGYAQIKFKVDATGDVFLARYFVQYKLENDGDYIPIEFELVQPVKDI